MFRTLSLIFLLVITVAPDASAAITYDLVFRLPGAENYASGEILAQPGEEFIGTQILLVETVAEGIQSPLAQANLNAFSARVSAEAGTGAFRNLTLFSEGGIPGGQNGESVLNMIALGPFLNQPGRNSVSVGERVREALLGTVDLIAPGEAGVTTAFLLDDADPLRDGDFTTFESGAFGLESIAQTSGGAFRGGSLTITAVPEPGSLLALSVIGLGGIVWHRRRSAVRRTAATA